MSRPFVAYLHYVYILKLFPLSPVLFPQLPQEYIYILPHLLPAPRLLSFLPYVVQYDVIISIAKISVHQDTQLSFCLSGIYLYLLLLCGLNLIPSLYPRLFISAGKVTLYLYGLSSPCYPLYVWHIFLSSLSDS